MLLHTSTGDVLQPVPATNGGFREDTEAVILAPPGGPWALRIDDEPMALDAGAWRWRPGYYAGEVTVQLLDAEERVAAEYLLDVAPDDKKLGRSRFAAMLDEVFAEDPLLVLGDEPATLLTGNEHQIEDPLSGLLGFARMRAYGPRFLHALHEAARQPRLVVRRRRAEEPPHRVRRLDAASLRSLVRNGALALAGDMDWPDTGRALHEIRVEVPIAEPHVDGAANRSVVALMHLVGSRLRRLCELLPRLANQDGDALTRTGMAKRLPPRLSVLERLDEELARLLRSEPWKRVTRPELSAAGLNALAADPLYARIKQMAWRALRIGVGIDVPEDRLWLSPTWEVFERWCFVRAARLLRGLLPELSWVRLGSGEHPSRAEAAWAGAAGPLTVELLLQPVFFSWDRSGHQGFRSISRERIPDLVIAWEQEGRRQLFVLDAKYSVSRDNVLQQMQSAHVYRDSLRWHGVPPAFALLLLPAKSTASWLAEPAFHQEHRVGTAVAGDELPEILRAALAGNAHPRH